MQKPQGVQNKLIIITILEVRRVEDILTGHLIRNLIVFGLAKGIILSVATRWRDIHLVG